MSRILAIDPGSTESAWVIVDADLRPVVFGKGPNTEMLAVIHQHADTVDTVAVEMVASYGMPVGAEVFETCVWIGQFVRECHHHDRRARLVYRREVKLHLCGQARAKDANVRQALIDRFGGKGTKKAPGWFYGFKADVWQAMALAVTVADGGES